MKKVLFLLVALLSVVGVKAQMDPEYVSFTGDPTELGVDNSGNVTTQTFTVKNGETPATVVAGTTAKVYVYDGVHELTNHVTINPLGEGKFTATIDDELPVAKLLLVFEEGYFQAAGKQNKRLTFYLDVHEEAVFTVEPVAQEHIAVDSYSDSYTVIFFVEKGSKDKLTVDLSAMEGETATPVTRDGGINLPDGVEASEDGSSIIVDATNYATEAGPHQIEIPEGAFRTKYTAGPAITVILDVREPVEFGVVTEPILNKDTKFTFYLDPAPGVPNAWDYGPTTNPANPTVTSVEVNGKTYTAITFGDGVYTVDMTTDDLKDLEGADSKEFDVTVNGLFFKFNSRRTTATGKLLVKQKKVAGVEISGETQIVSNLYTVVENVNIAYPENVTGADFTVVADNAYITDGFEFTTAVKAITKNDEGKYNVTFVDNLELGNEYLLVFPAGAVTGMGDDYVVYYSAEQTIHITVKKDFKFYDKIHVAGLCAEGETITTKANEVVADNYNSVSYIRNFTGNKEAWFVPFDYVVKADDALKFQKITAITEDEGVYSIHFKTVNAGEKVHANKPYIVTANAAGQKTIALPNNALVTPEPGYVACATTTCKFEIHGLTAPNTVDDHAAWALGKSGALAAVGNNASQAKEVSVWRFVIISDDWFDTDETYSKIVFADEAETTGINSVNVAEDGVIYNVAGQRVIAPVKGQVYIMNGQKFIAK